MASYLSSLGGKDSVVKGEFNNSFSRHSTFATRVEPSITEPRQRFTCVNPSFLPLALGVLIGLEPL